MFNEEKNTIENVEKSSPNWEEGAVKISDMSVSLSVCSLAFEKIENLWKFRVYSTVLYSVHYIKRKNPTVMIVQYLIQTKKTSILAKEKSPCVIIVPQYTYSRELMCSSG